MQVSNIADYRMAVKHGETITLATGRSRMEKNWKNKSYSWFQLLRHLEISVRTHETLAECMKMPKSEQDRIRDVGGFVEGALRGGRRKADTVDSRQLIILDADYTPADLMEDIALSAYYAYAMYTTHKHSPEKPRLRFVIPMDRPVTADEYETIARKLAEEIGIDHFDDTTYQSSRLMYWPSAAADEEYSFHYEGLPWLSADNILRRYPDWTDASYWPESSRAKESRVKQAKKQGDLTEKAGLISAFCRTYDVEDAIATFLPEVYVKCDLLERYTYAEGSTASGLVIYEDGRFTYSNHSTDPACGELCNAFDLVHIHRYGIQDEDAASGTPTTKLPSYKAMMELMQRDKETTLTVARERAELTREDFADTCDTEEDDSWKGRLSKDKKGLEPSLNNLLFIMRYDQGLKGIWFNQMADNLGIKEPVPWKSQSRFWRGADDARLEAYLSMAYTEFPKAGILTVTTKAADDRSYHPIREYLDGLSEWDGTPRVDTFLIDYLGTDGMEYVRSVTRKTLCATVHWVKYPGCKFDTVLVLCGSQGTGKSTLISRLGGQWFSDSLNLADTRDRTAAEKPQGYWIIGIGEMAGIGSVGMKTLRGFITTQGDRYRASYGRRVSSYPRQYIPIGTTNSEEGYLNDVEGGRRFWPVRVPCAGVKHVRDMTQEEISQIWAEVLYHVAQGEKLILPGGAADEVVKQQKEAMITDPREGKVRTYLGTLLSEDWYNRDLDKRRDFLYGTEYPEPEVVLRKDFVSCQEIWCECFGNSLKNVESKDIYTIKKILARLPNWENSNERKYIGGEYGRQRGYKRVF